MPDSLTFFCKLPHFTVEGARARQVRKIALHGAFLCFCDVRRNVTGERHAGLGYVLDVNVSFPKVQQQGIVIVDSGSFSGKIVRLKSRRYSGKVESTPFNVLSLSRLHRCI